MTQAACRDVPDPDMFFPEKGQALKGNDAIMICFSCPVRNECDDYQKRTDTRFGIWAGKYTKRHGE